MKIQPPIVLENKKKLKFDIGVSGFSFKVSSVFIASGSFLEDSTAWQFFKSLTIFIGVTKATSKQLIVFF